MRIKWIFVGLVLSGTALGCVVVKEDGKPSTDREGDRERAREMEAGGHRDGDSSVVADSGGIESTADGGDSDANVEQADDAAPDSNHLSGFDGGERDASVEPLPEPVTEMVGVEGAVLSTDGVTLEIPAGALMDDTEISIRPFELDEPVEGLELPSTSMPTAARGRSW